MRRRQSLHGQSSAARSVITSQQWLAERTPAIRLQSATWRLCHIHIAVGLRLGAQICEPRQCPCGAPVDARKLHGLSCRGDYGRSARHTSLNDQVWRAMAKTDIPALKEPSGLLRTDCKRPDGVTVTLLLWKQGKFVTWDVTVSDTA